MWEIVSKINQRRTLRRKVQLPCSVSLPDAGAPPARPLIGHTHDVSLGGVALIMPDIRIGDHDLTSPERTLRITLALPKERVDVYATPVRYERVGEGEGYLIGARITDVEARARFVKYIHTLN